MRLGIDLGTTRIVAAAGQPIGDISVWDEIQFPFDASLQSTEDFTGVAVNQTAAEGLQRIEEDDTGSGYERSYRLRRWAQSAERSCRCPRQETKNR